MKCILIEASVSKVIPPQVDTAGLSVVQMRGTQKFLPNNYRVCFANCHKQELHLTFSDPCRSHLHKQRMSTLANDYEGLLGREYIILHCLCAYFSSIIFIFLVIIIN